MERGERILDYEIPDTKEFCEDQCIVMAMMASGQCKADFIPLGGAYSASDWLRAFQLRSAFLLAETVNIGALLVFELIFSLIES